MAVPSNTHRQPALAQSSLQLQFLEAPPGQEFGFRLPDIASQTGIDTRTPTRSYFSGVASQPSSKSSGPPSSQGTSLFAGGSLGQASTAAMSHVASVCSSSSTSEWHLSVLPLPQVNGTWMCSAIPHLNMYEPLHADLQPLLSPPLMKILVPQHHTSAA